MSQTVRDMGDHYRPREIVDFGTDHERLLTLIQTLREMAGCVRMTVVVDCGTDHEEDC